MWLAAILAFGILTMWVPARWALSVFQVALFALAAVRIVQRRSFTLPFAGWMIAAAAAWGALQVAAGWSVDRVTTLDATLNWVTNLAAFMLAADLYRNADRRERFLRSALIFTSILAVVSIFTFLTSPAGKVFWIFDSGSDSRTLGPFVYQNQYAAFIEAVLPLAIVGVIARPAALAAARSYRRHAVWLGGHGRLAHRHDPVSRRDSGDTRDCILARHDQRQRAHACSCWGASRQ